MSEITTAQSLSAITNLEHGFTTRLLPKEKSQALDAATATLHQVHGKQLYWVSAYEKRQQQGDAIATTTPGLGIGVYSADCVPVLVAAVKENKAFAILAIHAGWRGTALQIAYHSLKEFIAQQGGAGVHFVTAVGPAISFDSFEVGEEVVAAFPNAEQNTLAKFLRIENGKRKYLFDLPKENERQIRLAGEGAHLTVEQIAHCTVLNPERYPSFRRDREQAGRILSYLKIHS